MDPFFKLKDLCAVCVIPMTIPRSYLHIASVPAKTLAQHSSKYGAP